MKYSLIILAAFALVLILTSITMAQPGMPISPSQAPIDGGLGFLAAAGGAYAIKKIRDRKEVDSDL